MGIYQQKHFDSSSSTYSLTRRTTGECGGGGELLLRKATNLASVPGSNKPHKNTGCSVQRETRDRHHRLRQSGGRGGGENVCQRAGKVSK